MAVSYCGYLYGLDGKALGSTERKATMASDDFEVIAYKILSYLYRCMKDGKKVDVAAMRQLVGCNERYFGLVVRNLQSKGYVEGFFFDGLSGVVIDSPSLAAMSDPAITMDGAVYVSENSRMSKCKDFLGHAFELALSAAVQAATSGI